MVFHRLAQKDALGLRGHTTQRARVMCGMVAMGPGVQTIHMESMGTLGQLQVLRRSGVNVRLTD